MRKMPSSKSTFVLPLSQVRVEANPQNRCQFRVTVASPLPPLTAQLKDLIVQQLRALP